MKLYKVIQWIPTLNSSYFQLSTDSTLYHFIWNLSKRATFLKQPTVFHAIPRLTVLEMLPCISDCSCGLCISNMSVQKNQALHSLHGGCAMRKCVFGHIRTAKAQTSLRIHAVWSGPSLSGNRTIGYYRMYQGGIKGQMLLWACAGWSESVHVKRHFFTWRGPCNQIFINLTSVNKHERLKVLTLCSDDSVIQHFRSKEEKHFFFRIKLWNWKSYTYYQIMLIIWVHHKWSFFLIMWEILKRRARIICIRYSVWLDRPE